MSRSMMYSYYFLTRTTLSRRLTEEFAINNNAWVKWWEEIIVKHWVGSNTK